ncbi:Non-heme dioxygenase N-terminal domain containing protein, partial [Trema orientale]
KEIPPHYFQSEAELEQVSDEESLEILVFDMSRLLDDQHPFNQQDELTRLHMACKDWGFFLLINHGVPGEEVIENMKTDTEFFIKRKKAYAQQPNSTEGYGQAFVVRRTKA